MTNTPPQTAVIAIGGNALITDKQHQDVASQVSAIEETCRHIADMIERGWNVIVTHGNGPQVGLLALQASSFDAESAYPFDVLGAATEGIIGYLIEQELGNVVPADKHVITVLTQVEVAPDDPAFADPTKFVGPVYTEAEARRLAEVNGWVVRPDGAHWRRVVPSPAPRGIVEVQGVNLLLAAGYLVICAGGGGIPTAFDPSGEVLAGVEAVIDKDRAAAVLGREVGADVLVIATDVPGVFLDWGTPTQRLVAAAHPDDLAALEFPAGSMGPKVEAAIAFARLGGGRAAIIGALEDLSAMLEGRAGTRVDLAVGRSLVR